MQKLAPGPRGVRELLKCLHLRKTNPIEFYEYLFRNWGDVVYFKAAGQGILMLNDPECIKQVLLTQAKITTKSAGYERFKIILGNGLLVSEGDFWLRQRRFLSWAFNQKNIEKVYPQICEQTRFVLNQWKNKKHIDLAEELNFLTLQIISVSLLGIGQEENGPKVRRSLQEMIHYLQTTRHIIIQFFLLFVPFVDKKKLALKIEMGLPFESTKRFKEAIETMDKIVLDMIEERRKANKHENLLDALIHARDDVDQTQMTDKQIRDETITMLVAGHETTANALTWTWHQILKHPEVYKKLTEEINEKVKGDIPTYEEVTTLHYTKAVIEESIRLYPPFWRVSRSNTEPIQVKGFDVPKGTSIITSIYTVQRNEKFWENPLEFRPERFLEGKEKIVPFSYFPFGGGPRVCIGANFSFIEALTIVASMVKQYEFKSQTEKDPEYVISLTLQPKGGCPVEVKAKND